MHILFKNPDTMSRICYYTARLCFYLYSQGRGWNEVASKNSLGLGFLMIMVDILDCAVSLEAFSRVITGKNNNKRNTHCAREVKIAPHIRKLAHQYCRYKKGWMYKLFWQELIERKKCENHDARSFPAE